MKTTLFLAVGITLLFAGAARAQTVSATCLVTDGATMTLSQDGAVEQDNDAQQQMRSRITLDQGAHTFVFGENRGQFADDGVTITAMARTGPLIGSWQIDRATGRLRGASYVEMGGQTVIFTVFGVCTPEGGRF